MSTVGWRSTQFKAWANVDVTRPGGPVTVYRAPVVSFQANFDLLVGTVENEDFRICEDIQRGFHAGGHDTVLYGRNEPGLAHYHRMIKSTLGIADADPAA